MFLHVAIFIKEDNAPTIKNNIIKILAQNVGQTYFLNCEWQEGALTYLIVVQVQ
jgi:hypothetical protein